MRKVGTLFLTSLLEDLAAIFTGEGMHMPTCEWFQTARQRSWARSPWSWWGAERRFFPFFPPGLVHNPTQPPTPTHPPIPPPPPPHKPKPTQPNPSQPTQANPSQPNPTTHPAGSMHVGRRQPFWATMEVHGILCQRDRSTFWTFCLSGFLFCFRSTSKNWTTSCIDTPGQSRRVRASKPSPVETFGSRRLFPFPDKKYELEAQRLRSSRASLAWRMAPSFFVQGLSCGRIFPPPQRNEGKWSSNWVKVDGTLPP